jgi:BolA family transcriptional regulator, general stress-responsive regulator
MTLGPIGDKIEAKLRVALSPSTLEVIDESNLHHGHVGAHPSGESHFRVRIGSAAFQGLNRVQTHRIVNEVLADELRARVHALAIEVIR